MTKNSAYPIFIIMLLVGIGFLLYLLAPILTPFLFGMLLAYLVNPLVTKLMRLHIPRLLAVIIVFLTLILLLVSLILFLIPLIEKQIAFLLDFIPSILIWVQDTIIPWFTTRFGMNETLNIPDLKSHLSEILNKAGGILTWMWHTILHSGAALILFLTNLVLIPVVTFYFLLDWNNIVAGFRNLLPRNIEPTVVRLFKESDQVLSAFFRGQLLVMLSLAIIYSVGLSLIGLKIGVMIGMISGLLTIVPYLGFIVGILSASIAMIVQTGGLQSIFWVALVFLVGQTMDAVFLTPYLVGDRIGLHPVAVIFAILAGGSLFGFFGVLLALPVAAVMMVWLRYVHQRYRSSALYQ